MIKHNRTISDCAIWIINEAVDIHMPTASENVNLKL